MFIEFRKQAGSTQAEFAAEAGISQATISRLESGQAERVHYTTAAKLKALGKYAVGILSGIAITDVGKPAGNHDASSHRRGKLCRRCNIVMPLSRSRCDYCEDD